MATIEEIQTELARRQQPQAANIEQIQAELSTRQPDQQSDPSIGAIIRGGIEGAASLASSIIAEPIAGIAGLAGAADPFSEKGQSVRNIDFVRNLLTFEPSTELGKGAIANIAEPLKPIAEKLQQVKTFLGDDAFEATGSPALAALISTLPEAALSLFGAKPSIKALTPPSKTPLVTTTPTQPGIVESVFKFQSPTKQRIAKLIEEGSTDIETAQFKISEPGVVTTPAPTSAGQKLQSILDIGGPKIVADKLAKETIKQGFDEGVIAGIKGSSKTDMNKMLKMVHIMEAGKKNARVALQSRPTDVSGDSLLNRFKVVRDANKKSGAGLDAVAKGLKGRSVDHGQAVNSFLGDLDNIGVKVNDDFSLDFLGSNIEGTSSEALKAQSILKTTMRRLSATKVPDAFDVHRMKKFIDSQITFGKTEAGLAGGSERILKSLRRNLDDLLDQQFPEYDKINKTFSETRTAIDNLQDVAGKKLNLTGKNADKSTGTLLRRLMSNAQSRVNLLDSVNELEKVAIKNGAKFDDDLLMQVLFADELDAVFKPVARTSFQGQIGQALPDVPVTLTGLAVKGAVKIAEKARNINEKAAFKSIKDLLKEGRRK